MIERLPKNYKRIDIVADTYRENSLKNNDRNLRGISDKVMISSSSSKIPRNFTDFLKNGDNKTRLIELIKDELVKNSKEILSKLSCEIIYFSISKLWKSCLIPRIEFPDTTEHGWKSNDDVLWTTNEFPNSIVELLASTENVDFQDATVYFSEEESDDD